MGEFEIDGLGSRNITHKINPFARLASGMLIWEPSGIFSEAVLY